MRHWWADTLFKRLFLLMWFGLVASHLVAYFVTTRVHAPPGQPAAGGAERLPVLPSLPPMGAPPDGPMRRGSPPDDSGAGPPPGPPPERRDAPGGLPAGALWLDYGVRFLAIGVVAWFGARWLSTPMRRLAAASEELGRALGAGAQAPPLDARHGTLEVRQTAQVFNAMAQRLHAQFDAQALLMAAISHDLRTPLARLRMRLESADATDAPAQTARNVADVQEMDALIGSALGLLREQHAPGAPERIDLTALVQSCVDDLAEQGAPAQMQRDAAPAIVQAQPAALKRVLDNLIGNALRHGGSARVAVVPTDHAVQVRIDDDGPGIAPDQLEAVFRPFHRADASRRSTRAGSGLGLYIARDLAERLGGSVRLSNRPEGGLRAELQLPRR